MRYLFLLLFLLLFPVSANAITFTSDATVTNHDYGTEQVVVTNGAHVTFDNVHWGAFNNVDSYEGRLTATGGSTIIVTNSTFGPGGCSDGILITGDSTATIKNNEFVGLRQGSCGPHVDAIQYYGGYSPEVSDNYVHDVSTGIVGFDSNGQIDVFKNNVLIGDEYHCIVCTSSNQNGVYLHNVILNKTLLLDGGHDNIAPNGNIIKDNVVDDVTVV